MEHDQQYLVKLYDKELRQKLLTDATAHVGELSGHSVEPDVVYKAMVSTKNKIYVAIPHHSALLSIDDVGEVSAAGCTGSASSASSAGSVGTACTTFSSAGSAASLGTVGTA